VREITWRRCSSSWARWREISKLLLSLCPYFQCFKGLVKSNPASTKSNPTITISNLRFVNEVSALSSTSPWTAATSSDVGAKTTGVKTKVLSDSPESSAFATRLYKIVYGSPDSRRKLGWSRLSSCKDIWSCTSKFELGRLSTSS
jgi:hypothetical protein